MALLTWTWVACARWTERCIFLMALAAVGLMAHVGPLRESLERMPAEFRSIIRITEVRPKRALTHQRVISWIRV